MSRKNGLPNVVIVNVGELDYDEETDDIGEILGDYLSDTFGFCHYGFCYEPDILTGDIVIFDIEWDDSE